MSDLKQVLVHLDPSPGAALRLQVARRIAQQHGSALTALYAASPGYLEMPYGPDFGPSVAAALVESDQARRKAARAAFDAEMRTPGPGVAWADTHSVPIIAAFAQQAMHADLAVLGQQDPGKLVTGLPVDFPQSVVIASGRPAIIVPYTGWGRSVGETVAIAWKESPESARAVAAALPLLARARKVHVLTWGGEAPPEVHGQRMDLRRWLHVHGIEAQWHAGGDEPQSFGEILLSRAFDLDADLLVMGCYGHSRARELVLGGASRTVLRSMTLPVLMAH